MAAYIIRRLIWTVPVVLLVILMTFGLMKQIEGNPFRQTERAVPAAVQANLERKFHLDKPWYVQYGAFLRRAVTGDFGTSLRGSSSLSFKQHWGARTAPRSILVCPLRGRAPALDVDSPMIRAGVALWQRLPRAWADALGPRVCGRFLA